jgi:hypothetical protein
LSTASPSITACPSLRLRQRVERALFLRRAEGVATSWVAPERRALQLEAERPAPAG